jgi:hypothetical protein
MKRTANKQILSRLARIGHLMRLYLTASIILLILMPLILSWFGFEPLQSLLAILLTEVCLYPTVRYFARKESGLPAMPVLCLAYALQFALPFFTHDATIELVQAEVKYLSDGDVTAALLLAIIGVCAIQTGYYWFEGSKFKKIAPVAELHLKKSKALTYCALVGVIVPLLFTFKNIIPEEFQQPLSSILRLLENQVLVVIGILGWITYSRLYSKWYVVWLYALVFVMTLRGVAGGTIEEALIPIGVLFFVKWLYTRRVSVPLVVTVILLILFLSPVKSDFRRASWAADDQEAVNRSTPEKILLWVGQATDYWADTLSGNRGLAEATASASGRADFLHQVAHIHSMTPGVVPYQNGETYSYFAVAAVPRILWPDKPVAGSANGFYAVSYGITTEEGAKTTTFGVSLLGEAFINFGWFGVVFVMMFQGIIICLLQHIFGGIRSGPGGQAVFIAFFIFFLNGIGSSAEIVFGGILQNLMCGCFLLLWAREKGTRILPILYPSRLPPLSLNSKQ